MTTPPTPEPTRPHAMQATAPKPLRGTLFWRRFLPFQLWRFLSINLKMIRMILKSHPHEVPPDRGA